MGKNVAALLSGAFEALRKWDKRASEPAPFKPELYCDIFGNAMYGLSEEQTEFIGDPSGEPFVVTVRRPGYIPVCVLIFAASEEDAKARVTGGIRRIEEKRRERHRIEQESYAKTGDRFSGEHVDIYAGYHSRAETIIGLIEAGNIYVEPFDKRCLTKAVWACNDYLA